MQSDLSLVVHARRFLTSEICEFELRGDIGQDLPPFSAGAHIKVTTPSGAVRSYSLTNDEAERDRYIIAVKREDRGRGGSLSMHEEADVGQLMSVTAPANDISVAPSKRYLLIAGGIGITPMISIVRKLVREERDNFKLVYLTRSQADTAYLGELTALCPPESLTIHHAGMTPSSQYDLWQHLARPTDTDIYYCGPQPLMEAIRLRTIHWPRSRLHFEDFAGVSGVDVDSHPFTVRQHSTGRVFEIPADKTILEVLRSEGLQPKSSCESGTCGTCRVRLVAGEPDHRDLVLGEDERLEAFVPCVSRAVQGELELDF
ncbi:PDR/VanB family oxidoreductase [Agrobacterium tumefaciens]|uniref:PDR/VanB family oxidoreductase n=1 Tax=Agrobacterium tumefaciens TaxID=358 RepID=UPI00287E7F0E|nr:PDR/VanB family oxidoreductase [Agrobacterium tumefaciens]MDS7595458.1 PDR/VanB family oxidoreductase [Agrobacterium tumefaciens]